MLAANTCVSINGIPTEIVISKFQDRLFIILTQFKKSGTLVLVKKETFKALEDHEEIYKLIVLLGSEDNETPAFIRTIAELVKIPMNTLFSIGLKDYSRETLNALIKELNEIKTWEYYQDIMILDPLLDLNS